MLPPVPTCLAAVAFAAIPLVGRPAPAAAQTTPESLTQVARFDAATDAPGDAVWTNELDPGPLPDGRSLPFAEPLSPVDVSSDTLPGVTKAYPMPAAATPDDGAFDFQDFRGPDGQPLDASQAVTAEVVLRLDAFVPGRQSVIWETGGPRDGLALFLGGPDGNRLFLRTDRTSINTDLDDAITTDFVHVVAVWDAGKQHRLYVNGILLANNGIGDEQFTSANAGGLGNAVGNDVSTAFGNNGTPMQNGHVAAFNFYSGAARDGEVLDLRDAFHQKPD